MYNPYVAFSVPVLIFIICCIVRPCYILNSIQNLLSRSRRGPNDDFILTEIPNGNDYNALNTHSFNRLRRNSDDYERISQDISDINCCNALNTHSSPSRPLLPDEN